MYPTLSFLMPSKNSQATIQAALNSLAEVFQEGDELLVADESTDGTRTILDAFQKKISLHYVSQTEPGIMSARLSLLKAATNQYVYFLDADDVLLKDSFLKVREAMTAHKADIYLFDGAFCNPDLSFQRAYPLFPNQPEGYLDKGKTLHTMFIDDRLNNLWCRIAKRSLFPLPELQKCLSIRVGEDRKIALALEKQMLTEYYLPLYVYSYRLSENGVTRGNRPSDVNDYIFILADTLAEIRARLEDEVPFLKTLGRLYIGYLIRDAYLFSDNKNQFEAYRKQILSLETYQLLSDHHLLRFPRWKNQLRYRFFAHNIFQPMKGMTR